MPIKNERLNPGSNTGGPLQHFLSNILELFHFVNFLSAVEFFVSCEVSKNPIWFDKDQIL